VEPRWSEVELTKDKVTEINAKIADLKARWPAHSVPPSMWQQLEELEAQLEEAKRNEDTGGGG
jgi:hypothetical protein